MGSYGGPAQGPQGAEFKLDTSFHYIYRQNEEEKIFIVVQLLFSELFVPQVFSNRAGPELRWPANTCVTKYCGIYGQLITSPKWYLGQLCYS